MEILDSGNRTEFKSGAVRDVQEDKGRMDLVPLDMAGKFINSWNKYQCDTHSKLSQVRDFIFILMDDNNFIDAAIVFAKSQWADPYEALMELSVHFKDGAKKYGDNNWQKGIPIYCYKSSALRHLLKALRGDQDEPHNRAFVWNCICAEWTRIHLPELDIGVCNE